MKIRVCVGLEFENVDNETDEEKIVQSIRAECERLRIGFDASECWVLGIARLEESEEPEESEATE